MIEIKKDLARNIWIHAQCLDTVNPFSSGAKAATRAIEHLGYVQIDTINVIERCHHHILYNRIPHYKQHYLKQAQSHDKTIFEYWTHALSYIPVRDFKYFVSQMQAIKTSPSPWFAGIAEADMKKVRQLLRKNPITIRDIKDDNLKEKEHEWDSKKPSKRALQFGFYTGEFVVSERDGMLKIYDLTKRHFAWSQLPKKVNEKTYANYLIDRGLRSQGLVSVDSICYLSSSQKKQVHEILTARAKKNELVEVCLQGQNKNLLWISAEFLERKLETSGLTHILSPFDPLIIQRKKLKQFFDYEHIFEAYVPKVKRKFGYFSLPVLHENNIVTLLDLKADRQNKKLLIQNWVWLGKFKSKQIKARIEAELDRFEKFQLVEG